MTRIDRSEWQPFLERFNREHQHWEAKVEAREPGGSTEVIVDDEPFDAVLCADPPERLVLSFGDRDDGTHTEVLDHPRDLVLVDGGQDNCSLVIAGDDGSGCIVQLTNRRHEH